MDEEDEEQDDAVVIGGDGPPDEASELRWIKRKVLHLLSAACWQQTRGCGPCLRCGLDQHATDNHKGSNQ